MEGINCTLCPRHCLIKPGSVGVCGNRINTGTKIEARFYGKFSAVNIDPVEKKPLYHFLPGTKTLSLGGVGCNLNCRFCQNWNISQNRTENIFRYSFTPEQVISLIKRENIPSLSFTYNEPLVSPEFIHETSQIADAEEIKTILVTAAWFEPKHFKTMMTHIEGANIDLKFFNNEKYRQYTGASLDCVLKNILEAASRSWIELTTLIIPGLNDSKREIEKMCRWITQELGSNIPLHLSAFYPAYKMKNREPTSSESLINARETALDCGLNFVYTGNIRFPEGTQSSCPDCRTPLIERNGYAVKVRYTIPGECPECHERLPGVFT